MPDMYAFQIDTQRTTKEDNQSLPHLTPNILPCQIHHDGAIESTNRFWIPVTDNKDGDQVSHFRGRKLRGRRVPLPEGYQGVIAVPTDRALQVPSQDQKDEDLDVVEIEPEQPVKILEMQGKFDEMIVWGHAFLPAADDTFVKGVNEWMQFAETMHKTPINIPQKDKE